MAYEVFDDVAFFWVTQTLLALILLPWTGYWIYTSTKSKKDKVGDVSQDRRQNAAVISRRKAGTIDLEPKGASKYLRPKYIIFGLLWVVFIFHTARIPNYIGEQMVSFEPFSILELEKGATPTEVKRAYRQLSLKYHPDKNPDNPEAHQKFILISKAYQTLTDEKARENIEKYGNPDGYQGVSKVTIGLPSFLTRKENRGTILLAYVLLIFVVPTVFIMLWWRRVRRYHESGVLLDTVGLYFAALNNDTMAPKYLIEILAASLEFRSLEETGLDQEAFKLLRKEVEPLMAKARFNALYVVKANHLLHGYLTRMIQYVDMMAPTTLNGASGKGAKKISKIRERLNRERAQEKNDKDKDNDEDSDDDEEEDRGSGSQLIAGVDTDVARILSSNPRIRKDLLTILPQCHRLLNVMFEIAISKGFVHVAFSVIELMQCISQAMWVNLSPLRQLPYLSARDVRALNKKNITSIQRFRDAPEKDKRAALRGLTDTQLADIDAVANLLPNIEVDQWCGVEDEDGIYPGDILTLKLDLFRSPAARTEYQRKVQEQKLNQPAVPVKKSKKTENKESKDAKEAKSGDDKENKDGEAKTETEDEDEDDLSDEAIFALAKPREKRAHGESHEVHAPLFPFPKKERWYVILLETNARDQQSVVALERLNSFSDHQTVKLHFRAPDDKGTYSYQLQIRCDSYVGCDLTLPVRVTVANPPPPKPVDPNAPKKSRHDDDVEEEELEGKWYYMGAATFWEFVLQTIILGVAFFFVYDWLQKKGYWQVWFQPVVDKIVFFFSPVTKLVAPYYKSYVVPTFEWLDRVTTRHFNQTSPDATHDDL